MATSATLAAVSTIKQEALDQLRAWLKPGDTVYTILRHVSGSGMTRHITPLCFVNGDATDIRYLTHAVHIVCGYTKTKDRDALVSRGCGMDMGFDMVYTLSRTLFPDWKGRGDRDGGYALNQRWL